MTEREKALEAALRDIARQRKTDEMPREDRHNGDFEGACDTMIDVARAALAMPATVDGADFLRGWEAGREAAVESVEQADNAKCLTCGRSRKDHHYRHPFRPDRMTDAPERIWLQDAGDYAVAKRAMDDLTWCYMPIDEHDTEYIRADIHEAEVLRLREALREIVEHTRNSGIEVGTVGERVAERCEETALAALRAKLEEKQ